ncbi:sensor histidine kinase [Streptomyces sp. NPDC094437]|uniref:sensor histidine kinase n=1 Tax=Streptomyces sp. NPDC094437 TaxID=3366060 RepID=UPI0038120CAF
MPRGSEMVRAGGWWRGKSTPAKVETYTRWSFHLMVIGEVPAIGAATAVSSRPALGWLLLALTTAHAALSMVTVSRALDWTRGARPQPVRLLWTQAVVTGAIALGALLVPRLAPGADLTGLTGAVFGIVLVVGTGVVALGMRGARRVSAMAAGLAVATGIGSLLIGMPLLSTLISTGVVLCSAGFVAFVSVFSVWLLDAVYALDEARETRTRLAVAEERLRFGRDLHDVMGRNLAVVALKSELAVQLARRGRPEAVDQMIEVQRIARETQREVRDVVRGYREADLGVELAGARGVLAAAGIDCEIRGEAAGLPAEVQSALGWVVRETTTNVLRHGNATRCRVRLTTTSGRVLLTVENDGADNGNDSTGVRNDGPGDVRAQAGSGLAGLRERLAEVGGTLTAAPAAPDLFRVAAEVPVPVPGRLPGQGERT